MNREVTLMSFLDLRTVEALMRGGMGLVVDLRSSQGQARPIEEDISVALRRAFVDYSQMPFDLRDENANLAEVLTGLMSTLKPVAVVTDGVEDWRETLSALGFKCNGLSRQETTDTALSASAQRRLAA